MKKILHLEIKANDQTEAQHKFYGSLVALTNDNKALPYHTLKWEDLTKGWENELFTIRQGELITSKQKNKHGSK
jgi:superfamily I DNA and/or RNA helicase